MKNRKSKIKDFDDCGQKTSFDFENVAWNAARHQYDESIGNVVKKPYRCKRCKKWHLTTVN